MRSKKGFTLVEVVVALGILTIVLAATVTLIIGVVNLALVARDKTEATALVQKGLSETISRIQKCDSSLTTQNYSINGKSIYIYINKAKDPSGNYAVADENFKFDSTGTLGGTINSAGFYKVTAVVTWSFRGKDYSTEATQFVGKNL